jgi:hypothetical protein
MGRAPAPVMPRRAAQGRGPRHPPPKRLHHSQLMWWRRMGGPLWETLMVGAPRRGESREGHQGGGGAARTGALARIPGWAGVIPIKHHGAARAGSGSRRRRLEPSTPTRYREIVRVRKIRRKDLGRARRTFGCHHGFAARPVSS